MKKSRIFSGIALLVLVIAAAVFFYLTYRSQLIPPRIWLIAMILGLVIILLIVLLVVKSKHSFSTVLGGVLALLLVAGLAVASVYINRALDTAQAITNTKTEVATVSVFMIAEETDESTALTADMRFGILEEQDRENTDEVLRQLEEELESQLQVKSYRGVTSLVDALFGHEVDAMIINSSLFGLLDETEGYEKLSERVREIKKTQVMREVAVTAPVETPKPYDRTTPESGEAAATTSENRTFVLYLSGIDNRGELIEKSRSDSNILAVVNPDSHQILLLSTPRDYFVPLVFGEKITSRDKLTHAGIYGVQVSVDTLSRLYETNVDYYFRVNFDGFIDIVEAMGGVTVYVDHEITTTEYTFPEGLNELNGYKALSFVRNRFLIGDRQRGRNQLAFIKGVIDKAQSTDMLLRFNDILTAVEGCFETSMPYDLISALVREQIESGAKWNIVSYDVTGTGTSAVPFSMDTEAYVIFPDAASVAVAKDLIQQVYDGKTIEAP